jgi:hypothetical protein
MLYLAPDKHIGVPQDALHTLLSFSKPPYTRRLLLNSLAGVKQMQQDLIT